jgi:TRAP-type C4-dicarboxylate transport system permease small subunit
MTVEPAGLAGSVPPDEPAAARALRRIDGALGLVEVGLLILFLAILIGTAVYQVIADQLLGNRETWPYELIRYGVFAVAMSGGALAAQRQGMFNMDLVTRKFGPRLRSILRIATAVLVAALCFQVVRSGLDLRSGQEQLIEAYELISPARAYGLLVAGFSLIALHFLLHGAIEVIYLAGGRLPPEPPHGGHG